MQELQYEDLFHEPLGDGYSTSANPSQPMTFPDTRMRVHFTIEADMVGKKFGMSERYSGAGLKACNLRIGREWISKRKVGTGQCFQMTIRPRHVGTGFFDYNQRPKHQHKTFKSALECYLRHRD